MARKRPSLRDIRSRREKIEGQMGTLEREKEQEEEKYHDRIEPLDEKLSRLGQSLYELGFSCPHPVETITSRKVKSVRDAIEVECGVCGASAFFGYPWNDKVWEGKPESITEQLLEAKAQEDELKAAGIL